MVLCEKKMRLVQLTTQFFMFFYDYLPPNNTEY